MPPPPSGAELAAAQRDAPHVKGGDAAPEIGLYVKRIEDLRRRIVNVSQVLSTVSQKMENLITALSPHLLPPPDAHARMVAPLSAMLTSEAPSVAASVPPTTGAVDVPAVAAPTG